MEDSLILVVDDNDGSRYAKAHVLRGAGYRIREAATGREALHLAATERPYLICLDVHLPDMSGIDVCRKIKQNPATVGMLVLQMSATFVGEEDKIRGLEGGADAYLVIPVEPRELLATVRALLRIRQAEQALRDSEERYRLAARATNDVIWDWDLVTNTVRWNEAVGQLFGWNEACNGTDGHWWEERLHPDERRSTVERVHAVIVDPAQQNLQLEYRFRRADGSYAEVFDRGYMIRGVDGRAVRVIGAMLDMTERKRAQAQLLQLNVDLERRVRDRTAELVRSQQRLRALATELTLTEQRERRRIATEMHDHLAQLLALGLLKLSQARHRSSEAGTVAILEGIDQLLHEAIEYTRTLIADLTPPGLQQFGFAIALKWLGEQMGRHGLHVELETEQEHLPVPDDEALLLFQSVRELLFNVVKHARTDHATVSLQIFDGKELRLTVSDQGAGFDPASLGEAARDTSGFGLFSVHARLESLGGRCEITSAPGYGTRATLSVPYRVSVQSGSHCPDPSDQAEVMRTGRVRVLLVDDHTLIRQGLRSVLDGYEGLEVIGEAGDGQQAVQLARVLKPDVVLMDINLPKIDGIEATRRIKQQDPRLIVIGLSMHCSETLQAAMRAAGAAGCISKDAAADRLTEAIYSSFYGP